MKVSELVGSDLDYWVAKSLCWEEFERVFYTPNCHIEKWAFKAINIKIDPRDVGAMPKGIGTMHDEYWHPSVSKYQADGIINIYNIGIENTHTPPARFIAWMGKEKSFQMDGQTPFIAAMRCFVVSQLGYDVGPVPIRGVFS